jgi:hypothetical protein
LRMGSSDPDQGFDSWSVLLVGNGQEREAHGTSCVGYVAPAGEQLGVRDPCPPSTGQSTSGIATTLTSEARAESLSQQHDAATRVPVSHRVPQPC